MPDIKNKFQHFITAKDILEVRKYMILIENKFIICALGNLHYQISRDKFEPEVRGSNPGSGSNFSFEI